MKIGTQIIVPEGYSSLKPGFRYYFLSYNRKVGRVNLVFYLGNKKSNYSTHVISMGSLLFEAGVESGWIVEDEVQLTMPPWFVDLVGNKPTLNNDWISYARGKHQKLVLDRLEKIQPLLDISQSIIKSDKPETYIKEYVKNAEGKLNYVRIKTWFFAYILHSMSLDALLPGFSCNGRHSKDVATKNGVRVGKKSRSLGRKGGAVSSKELCFEIVEGFVKHAEMGKPITRIYSIVMEKKFGCKTFKDPSTGLTTYYQPEGKPYPSIWQFKYRIKKEFTPHSIAEKIYGPKRAKALLKADEGPFTENVGNLMERVEFDGYYVKDRPRSFLGNEYLTRLCVVRAVDVATGLIVGIGFSIDSEVAEAYEMCLFSMSLDKKKFCKLFGIKISTSDWPCSGMSAMEVYDRGPALKLLKERVDRNMVLVELTPSYSGPSKAIVEASHPRDMTNDESPSFKVSHLDYIQMVKSEIFRVIEDNKKSDASSRLTPNMLKAGVYPYPLSIWKYMEKRGRSDAYPMKYDEAIRKFLVKVNVIINRKGAFLENIRYSSDDFVATGILDKAAKEQQFLLSAYIMTACVRTIWISLDGKLYEVEALLPINDNENQLYMSLSDLTELNIERGRMLAQFNEHKLAVTSETRIDFYNQVGVDYDAADIVQGRPKKTKKVMNEVSDIKKLGRG